MKDFLCKLIQEELAKEFKNCNIPEVINIENVARGVVDKVDLSDYRQEEAPVKAPKRPYTLSMMRVTDKREQSQVAGLWQICVVCGDDQQSIPFKTKASKVLYTFFMLHAGEGFWLSDLRKYHDEVKRIALALYYGPGEHTQPTCKWAEDIATRLCSRYGVSDSNTNNKQRSEALSKISQAVYEALGEEAGEFVIQGKSREEKRVLRLSPDRVKVPREFLEETTDWQGGFAA